MAFWAFFSGVSKLWTATDMHMHELDFLPIDIGPLTPYGSPQTDDIMTYEMSDW